MNYTEYFKQAQEYQESAEMLLETINKYKKQLKGSRANRELLNSMIFHFERRRSEALGMAHSLEAKAKKIEQQELKRKRIKTQTAKALNKLHKS